MTHVYRQYLNKFAEGMGKNLMNGKLIDFIHKYGIRYFYKLRL